MIVPSQRFARKNFSTLTECSSPPYRCVATPFLYRCCTLFPLLMSNPLVSQRSTRPNPNLISTYFPFLCNRSTYNPPRPAKTQRHTKMGCRLGRQKETLLFRHNDVSDLDAILGSLRAKGATVPPTNIFVAVESVYSMDGDLAPLQDIMRVAGKHSASVIVDEAHG